MESLRLMDSIAKTVISMGLVFVLTNISAADLPGSRRTLTVRGTVTTADGQPAADAQVIEYGRDDGHPAARTRTSKTGEFILGGIANDRPCLILVCDEVRRLKGLSELPGVRLRREPNDAVMDMVITPTVSITGKLVIPRELLADLRVSVRESLPPGDDRDPPVNRPTEVYVTVRRNPDGSYRQEELPLASRPRIDADGQLLIPFLLPNRDYELSIYGKGVEGCRIERIRVQDVRNHDLGIIEIGRARDLEITIVDTAGQPLPDVVVSYRSVPAPASTSKPVDTSATPTPAVRRNSAVGQSGSLARLFGLRPSGEPEFTAYPAHSDKNGRIVLNQVPDRELILKPAGFVASRKLEKSATNAAPAPESVVWPSTLAPAAETRIPHGTREAKIVVNTTPRSN